ncbi:MAG: serine hydrolase [Bacteroidota bacterium]
MHKLLRLFQLVVAIMIISQSCEKADVNRPVQLNCTLENDPVYTENPKSAELQSLIENYVKQGLPGIILLVKDDNGFYIGSAGMADIKEGIVFQSCHISKICSVTKMELGVAIMRLQEKGILSLDDPIRNYISADILDKIENCDQPLTIRNLMSHTSGIYDVIGDQDFYLQVLNDPGKHWTAGDLLKYVYHKDAMFEFDHAYTAGYSNTNYTLLSMIVEAATNKTHSQVLHEEVIDAVGMTDTYYFWHDPLPDNIVAQGYYDLYNNGTLMNLTNWNTGSGNGFGGMYGTIWDMYLFIDALFVKKTLLTEESIEQMLVFNPMIESRKLLGVSCYKDFIDVGNPEKDYAWGHRGRDLSYSADLFYFPEHNAIMSMMVNYGTYGESLLRPPFLEMRDELARLITRDEP